jgi:general secretion pathway protein J
MSNPIVETAEHRQSGATLIELVAALAIIALTFAIAGGALRLLSRSGEIGTQLIGRHDMLSRGIDALRGDIERLERVIGEDKAKFVFRGEERELTFVVMEPPHPFGAGLFLVRYSIDGAGKLVRHRALFDAKEDHPLPAGDEVAILEGPYTFRFSYWERKGGRERWISRWTDYGRLPELIRLEMLGQGSAGRAVPALIFRPRVEAELGCVQGDGLCTRRSRGVLSPQPAGAGGRKD